jgi:hypothetical protein
MHLRSLQSHVTSRFMYFSNNIETQTSRRWSVSQFYNIQQKACKVYLYTNITDSGYLMLELPIVWGMFNIYDISAVKLWRCATNLQVNNDEPF